MIDKELIKSELDKIPNKYLGILYKIIKVLETSDVPDDQKAVKENKSDFSDKNSWMKFVAETYGCLSGSPLQRPDQGRYETRDIFQ